MNLRQRVVALPALSLLVAAGVLIPGPASAETRDCQAVEWRGESLCAEFDLMNTAVSSKLSAAAVSEPSVCSTSVSTRAVAYDRFNVCWAGTGEFRLVDPDSWETVGSVRFSFSQFSVLSAKSKTFDNHWRVTPTSTSGDVDGLLMAARPACSSQCAVASGNTKLREVATGTTLSWSTKATSKVGKNTVSKQNRVQWWVQMVASDGSASDYFDTRDRNIRCDTKTAGLNGSPGCVVADAVPAITVTKSALPSYYTHVSKAQANGLPKKLHRLIGSSLTAKNTAKACPAAWKRPSGKQRDEYPMKTTYEGAYTTAGQKASGAWKGNAKGRTFSGCRITKLPAGKATGTKYSACMIDAKQKKTADAQLTAFFKAQRVLDDDAFTVRLSAK